MKILHTSDWHLGRMIYGRSLLPDQEYFIEQVLFPALDEENPDLVLLAGDVYDRQVAPVPAIWLFDRVLTELHRRNIPLAVISGNHDGPDRMALGASMLRESGIYFATSLENVFQPIVFPGGDFPCRLYLLPYCEPAEVREYFQDGSIRGFTESYQAVLDRVRETLDPNACNILAAHCFVAGGILSDSESPVYVGGIGEVNPAAFQGFDYVALGHLHAPQKAGANGRYSGSPLKYSFDEERQRKSLTLIETGKDGCRIRELPVRPLHDMRTLSGTMEELLSLGKQNPSEDYLYLRIQEKSPVYMPSEQLRPYYPNLLGLHCDWLSAPLPEKDRELREQLLRRKADEEEVFYQFMEQICGETPTEDDRAFLEELLRQVKSEEA